MGPVRPKTTTAGQEPIVVCVSKFTPPTSTNNYSFDGAISVRHLPHPTRLFNLEVTFDDHHPHMQKLRAQEPPQHFHYLQFEYIQMLEGELYVDVGEKRVQLTPSDGELEIPPWCRNRAIPLPPSEDGRHTRFLLSGPGADGPYMLDAIFYENYYRYMDQALAPGGEGISVVQVLCVSLFCLFTIAIVVKISQGLDVRPWRLMPHVAEAYTI